MDYTFHLQDPTSGETLYLGEALIASLRRARRCRAVFAFASRNGVQMLFADPDVLGFLATGEFQLVVGIDAVTNRPTLERLQELEHEHDGLRVRVFWNRTAGLFHPKFIHVSYAAGRHQMIVGSGNLTPGGLRRNFEGYALLRFRRADKVDLTSLDSFFASHSADLRPIDQDALARASKNVVVSRRRRGKTTTIHEIPELSPPRAAVGGVAVAAATRVLVARLPRAGDRWHQAHFNVHVVEQFFRIRPDSPHRVFLAERRRDGSCAPQEMRPCVYSRRNRNMKIELGARRGLAYPSVGGRPIAIFKETQVRTFDYMILLPGEDGYAAMQRLTEVLPPLGQGVPRVLTNLAAIRAAWPTCPLL